ncbi:hypothetical protein C0992_007445, partial [Termitomyces sp. T32_za158]
MFSNSTSGATLYSATDFSSLSWFEQKWVAWYVMIGNPVIATGLMSFLLHEIVYFGRAIPWIIIDAIPYFRKWKLQPSKVPTPEQQWECTRLVLFSHFTIELPTIWLFHPLAESIGMSTYQVPFPPLKTMVPQIAFFFFFEDFFHFLAHQALHTGVLYKHIHKIHHKYSAPFGLAAEYAHPAEVMILGTGTILGPLLYCYFTRNFHIVTMYIWITLRLFQAIDAHSGYGTHMSICLEYKADTIVIDFPWSLQHILPFWSGAEHHDFHHMAFTNNFSTSFRWWDRIFGTDSKYREYRTRVAIAKKAMKNASEEARAAIEKKLLEEVEAEGIRAEAEAEGSVPKTVKPSQIAELITKLLSTSTDDLHDVLSQIDVWIWPRTDLNAWIKVLNKFDVVLEDVIREYHVEDLQLTEFTPSTKRTVTAVLKFERLLLENSTNRKMFNSYDVSLLSVGSSIQSRILNVTFFFSQRINALLFAEDLDVIILALNVLLRPAQQYSSQAAVSHALGISTPKLLSLVKRWPHLREYGVGLVDLAKTQGSPEVDRLPVEAREVNFSFYKTETDGERKEKESKMETDPSEVPQSSPRKSAAPPSASGSGAIAIHVSEEQLVSKPVMVLLSDLINAYKVPDDEKFELLTRIRAAKALAPGQEADRVKLITIRLLAIAIYGHTHPESQASTSLFLYEPDVIAHISELLQIDQDIHVHLQTTAIAALDSLARYRQRNQEVLTAVNAGVNHGILMALVRKTLTDAASPDSTLPQSFIDALLNFVAYISSHSTGGNMVVGAGLIPVLIEVINNRIPSRLPVLSKTMQLIDNILYGYTNAFNIFCASRGIETLVDRIEYEVDINIKEHGSPAAARDVVGSQGEIPIARSAALKHILRSMHRMMQSSGTAEGLRGLIDLSLLKSIKKVIEHRVVFGPTILPLAINIMATFVHNEPTSLVIIQEAGLPETFYKTIEAGLEPSIEVIQSVANAIGALCLNEVGQAQLVRRPSIIPGMMTIFTSERHLKVLLEKENAVLVGTSIDELIRHHPSLKPSVFDAIKATIIRIEELGEVYKVPDDSKHWYQLVPSSSVSSLRDEDVTMEDVEGNHTDAVPEVTVGGGDATDEDQSSEPKSHDNTVVLFIDALGRFLEGLFQHTPHCRDFITAADGLDLLGRLTSLPCLPYDYANSVASDSMVQVMRTLTEVASDETLQHLARLVKQSLAETVSFWKVTKEPSKLLPLVDIQAEGSEAANRRFRDLITLHIRVTLLSDVFSTAGYAHGRAAIGLLLTLMHNLSSEVLSNLGSLHRATIWENITLNVGLVSRGIAVKTTPPPSPLEITPNPSTAQLLDANSSHNALVEPSGGEGVAPSSSGTAMGKKSDGPQERNAAALRHLTHGLPAALAPLFQSMVKMFHARRNPELAQRKQVNDTSATIADVMVKYLEVHGYDDVPSLFAYYSVVFGVYSVLLVDERTTTQVLNTIELLAFFKAGGFEAILNVCRTLMGSIERIMKVGEEERTKSEAVELNAAFTALKVALHLIRPIITSKPLIESGQTSLLFTRDKKDTDPEYFEPHNFLVKLRTAVLPLVQALWSAPWLISAPLDVSKPIVKTVLELVNGEGEEMKSDSSLEAGSGVLPPTIIHTRPPGADEGRVQILMDMGFPRSAVERALIRTNNNLNAATEILLSQPFPLPPDPEPETEAEQSATDPFEAASSERETRTTTEVFSETSGDVAEVAFPIGKNADEWRRDLDEAREPLRAGFSRQALLLIDEHVSLLFELHVIFVRPNNAHRVQAIQDLVDDVKAFSPFAYDVQEQPLANRCRLLALVLSESPSLLNQGVREVLLESLLALLSSCVDRPDHPPRWLATHLLVTEALFTLAAEPRTIILPKEGEPIFSEIIAVGPPLTDAKAIVFNFCLRLLGTSGLPGDEFLSVLRLLVFLTRDHDIALQFLKGGGVGNLLKRVKEASVVGSSAYIATILRHIVEDPATVRQIIQHTIKRYFGLPRNRVVDVANYMRSCSSLALRNPETFLEVTQSLCLLGSPYSTPTISLKPEQSMVEDKRGDAEVSTEMQVDQPTVTSSTTASFGWAEGVIHALISELASMTKSVITSHPPAVSSDRDVPEALSGAEATVSSAISSTTEVGHGCSPLKSQTETCDYVSFIMQCLSELLFSYDSCKVAFLSYSFKKRAQTPAKELNKFKSGTLTFLLNELITFGTIIPQDRPEQSPNRNTLCTWAMSVIVALCVDSVPNHEVKEISADLVSVRKFVLEAVSRAIKDPPPNESTDARYGRLLALAELCHRLLTVRSHATHRKQIDDNPTHIAKVMLEKNFVATLTTALSEIDLNYPNIRRLVPAMLKPLEYLTKLAIKMSRLSGKSKDIVGSSKSESESSISSTDEEDDSDMEEEVREETPDLYRNSALGMYGGEMDDAHYGGEDEMDEDGDDDED